MTNTTTARIADFCVTGTGGTPSREKADRYYLNGTIPWVKSGELREETIYSTEEHVTELALKESNVKQVPAGALLLAMYGATVGRLATLGVAATTNQAVCHIIPDPNQGDVRYLFHALRNQVESIVQQGVGGAQPNISQGIVRNIRVPLPSLFEQRRIAEILDEADALCAKRRAAIVQLDTLTQSIFLDMFGDPIANPRQFPIRPMIDLVDADRPITYGILMPGPDQEDGVPYVRVVDMRDGGISLSGIRRTSRAISDAYGRSLVKTGDLLMSIRGHVGRLAVVPDELDGANITQDSARLAIKGVSSAFIRECLRTNAFQRWMAKHTKGVAVRGINLGDVKQMPIITPSLKRQQEFSHKAQAITKMIAEHRQSLRLMNNLFSSTQHSAFEGKI